MNAYICYNCHQTFEKGRSDEETEKEAQTIFGEDVLNKEGRATLCEPCWKKFMEWWMATEPKQ